MVQSLHFDPKTLNEVWFELLYDKTNKTTCAPREDSDQPGHPPSLIRVFAVGFPGWSESSLCAQWVAKDPGCFVQTEKTDQTGQMPRLIWVFAGRTGHFVSFVMRWLVLVMHSYYCIIEFIKLIGENRSDALSPNMFYIFNNTWALVCIRSSV